MKIHPLFKRIVDWSFVISQPSVEAKEAWYAAGCPVVEEPKWYSDPHDCRKILDDLAAANARIKELEAQGGLEQHKHVIMGRDVGCQTCRNEALEEAAKDFECLFTDTGAAIVGNAIAERIRGLKR